ncbi:MAG: GNAT family N-acetyltransferase [Caldilineaceae bacterium]
MIRSYQATDLDDLLTVWAAATAVGHPFLVEAFLQQERENITNIYLPQAETWVWEVEGRVVGFIALNGNEVGGLFLDPRYHGQGIGRALMDHARSLRAELEVEVFVANPIGRRFYDRYGFVVMAETIGSASGFPVLRLRLPATAARE